MLQTAVNGKKARVQVIEKAKRAKVDQKRLPGMQGTKARRASLLHAHKKNHAHEYTYLYTRNNVRTNIDYTYTHNIRTYIV